VIKPHTKMLQFLKLALFVHIWYIWSAIRCP